MYMISAKLRIIVISGLQINTDVYLMLKDYYFILL